MGSLLSIRNVAKTFGKTSVLRDVSLEVAEGEFLTIRIGNRTRRSEDFMLQTCRLLDYSNLRGSSQTHCFWKKRRPFLVTVRLITMWKVVSVARMLLSATISYFPSSRSIV